MSETTIFKSAVCQEVNGANYFRTERAEQYPDDTRNQQSADCLAALAQSLRQMSDDNSSLQRCFTAYKSKHQRAGNIDAEKGGLDEDVGLWFPNDDAGHLGVKAIFTRYGFDSPTPGDADEFLSAFADEIVNWDIDGLKIDD